MSNYFLSFGRFVTPTLRILSFKDLTKASPRQELLALCHNSYQLHAMMLSFE